MALLDMNKAIFVDSELLIETIEQQIKDNTAGLKVSLDTVVISIKAPRELNLPPSSEIRVAFITNNSYQGLNYPNNNEERCFVWDFCDFELDYIDLVLASTNATKGIRLSTRAADFSRKVMHIMNQAEYVTFIPHESSKPVGLYGKLSSLVQNNPDLCKEHTQEANNKTNDRFCEQHAAIEVLAKTGDVESIYLYLLNTGEKHTKLKDVVLNSGQAKWIRLYCQNISGDLDMIKALIATGDSNELLEYQKHVVNFGEPTQ